MKHACLEVRFPNVLYGVTFPACVPKQMPEGNSSRGFIFRIIQLPSITVSVKRGGSVWRHHWGNKFKVNRIFI